MRYYETIYIVHPDLTEEDIAGVSEKYARLLEQKKAQLVKVDVWGRQKLAYEIEKCSKGYYIQVNYGGDEAAVNELERRFKIDDQVLRFLTVKVSDTFDPSRAEADAKAKRAEAEGFAEGLDQADRTDEDDDDRKD